VSSERLLRVLKRLTTDDQVMPPMTRFCELGAELSGTTGAGIMLMVEEVRPGTLCVSDEVSRVIEDLQHTLGEGPCVDAYNEGRPVLEPDLASPATQRWAAFTPAAVAAGARAIFGFPLQIGATRLGALNLYRDTTGPLSEDEYADVSIMAEVAARNVIDLQSQAPPGALAAELEEGTSYGLVVHQASGMVSVQLGVSVGEALVRLRAHAFAADGPLAEVARDVVARRLRFDDSMEA
jgi:hypothetical protein